ncbi:MAG: PRC-barrel domain containing protein [Rhodobacteraceae bacterium]|nr:MAG: PRC-barrel domain containing protein [Paracoccaceae bacterium]
MPRNAVLSTALAVVVASVALAEPNDAAPAPERGPDPTFVTRAEAVLLQRDGVLGADVYAPNERFAAVDRLDGGAWNARAWDNVGSVSDVLVDETGHVLAVVVDLGGFLGIGAKPVAIAFDAVRVRAGPDEDGFRVVLDATRQQLEDAPRFDPADVRHPALRARERRERVNALARHGFTPVERDRVTADEIAAAQVFDVDGDAVGRVAALVFDDAGAVEAAVVDVGGWALGGWIVGDARRVAVPFDAFEAFSDDAEMRLYADIAREEFEAMPRYEK